MIRCHLSRMMGERRLRIADVSRQTGLHRSAITSLYEDKAARIDLVTMNKLCQLFDCKLGDLLEYVPDGDPAP